MSQLDLALHTKVQRINNFVRGRVGHHLYSIKDDQLNGWFTMSVIFGIPAFPHMKIGDLGVYRTLETALFYYKVIHFTLRAPPSIRSRLAPNTIQS